MPIIAHFIRSIKHNNAYNQEKSLLANISPVFMEASLIRILKPSIAELAN